MPRPTRKQPSKEPRTEFLSPGQKWKDTKFRAGTRVAEITMIEGRMAVARITDMVDGKASTKTERIPVSVFGAGSAWSLVP